MDESFDCWGAGKNKNDYHLVFEGWHSKDLRSLVRRDRNHPSVILWSIGNEISEQGWGQKLSQQLADIVHSEDLTRLGDGGVQLCRGGLQRIPEDARCAGLQLQVRELRRRSTRRTRRSRSSAARRRRRSARAANTSSRPTATRRISRSARMTCPSRAGPRRPIRS